MRRKKQQRLKEEAFWANLLYCSEPRHLDEVPEHLDWVKLRRVGVDDEGLELMVTQVKSINMLDLDGCDITIEGLRHLTQLDFIKELRLKECRLIGNDAMEVICQIRGLELLHLGSTAINVYGLDRIGCLTHLKKLLISATEEEMAELPRIDALLVPGCQLIVNHRDYQRAKPEDPYGGYY